MIPEQLGIARRALNVVWEAGSMGGGAMALLLEREPTIATVLGEIARECPVAETSRTFKGEHFERLQGHARSFWLRLREGVLVFKGTELFSSDYCEILGEAWHKRELGQLSAMDHFAIREDEVYLGLTKRVAVGGAQRAWAWVSAHTEVFRELPRTPFPLLVLEVPDNVTQEFEGILLPFLSDRLQFSAERRSKVCFATVWASTSTTTRGFPFGSRTHSGLSRDRLASAPVTQPRSSSTLTLQSLRGPICSRVCWWWGSFLRRRSTPAIAYNRRTWRSTEGSAISILWSRSLRSHMRAISPALCPPRSRN